MAFVWFLEVGSLWTQVSWTRHGHKMISWNPTALAPLRVFLSINCFQDLRYRSPYS
jgi:hypothetical protein